MNYLSNVTHAALRTGAAFLIGAAAAMPMTAQAQPAQRPDTLAWAPCAEDPKLQCSVLRVPVSHAQPAGPSFGMAVIRAPATQPAQRIGVLMVNPGGPGGSGVDFVLAGIAADIPVVRRLRERFDIVSFDPRGAHRSNPVRCPPTLALPPADADAKALASHFDEEARRYVQGCEQLSGPFVFTLSVNNVARDMELLRRALGEATLSLTGFSAGTQLGAVYASMFPQRVRALALDAGMLPHAGGDGLLDYALGQRSASAFALRRMDQLCRADAACPLQAQGVIASYDRLAARLRAVPATVAGTTLSHLELDLVAVEAQYGERQWPGFVAALQAALAQDYAPLHELLLAARRTIDRFQAYTPTICGTYGTRLSASQLLAIDATTTAEHPRLFSGNVTPTLASERFSLLAAVAICSAWPRVEETVVRDLRQELKTPVAIFTSDFDNATPPQWSRALASALGFPQSVVRYRGGGHGVLTSVDPCFDDLIVAYLIELRAPPEGASCPARPIPFGTSAVARHGARP